MKKDKDHHPSKCACPMLQVLSNTGKINPDNVTVQDLRKTLMNDFMLDERYSTLFTNLIVAINFLKNDHTDLTFDKINLYNWFAGECDASLSREDFYLGDNVAVNKERVKTLQSFSEDKKYLTLRELVRSQIKVIDDSMRDNYFFNLDIFQFLFVKIVNITNIYLLLSITKNKTEGIPLKWIKVFFVDAKMPADWKPRKTSFETLMNCTGEVLKLYFEESLKNDHLLRFVNYQLFRGPFQKRFATYKILFPN